MTESDVTKILMIDDSEPDFVLTSRQLGQEEEIFRHDMTWVSSYEDGAAQMCSGDYNICIVDYKIDNRTGIDLIREARLKGADVPVILITGVSMDALDPADLERLNISRFLAKSKVNASTLISVICDTLLHFKK